VILNPDELAHRMYRAAQKSEGRTDYWLYDKVARATFRILAQAAIAYFVEQQRDALNRALAAEGDPDED
jgi:hypothetical protein